MYTYRAHVISVHDADTLRADIDLGFGIWTSNQPIRLNGIDAPELGTTAGRNARDWLRLTLPVGAEITLRTYKDKGDKYGRWLADITVGSVNVNQALIDAGHARPYEGGKR